MISTIIQAVRSVLSPYRLEMELEKLTLDL